MESANQGSTIYLPFISLEDLNNRDSSIFFLINFFSYYNDNIFKNSHTEHEFVFIVSLAALCLQIYLSIFLI